MFLYFFPITVKHHNSVYFEVSLFGSNDFVFFCFHLMPIFCTFMFQTCTCSNFSGRDKRAYIAVLRQAKIYPPRQAEAAADRGVVQLVHCGGSCIAAATFKFVAAAIHEPPHEPYILPRGLRRCRSRR